MMAHLNTLTIDDLCQIFRCTRDTISRWRNPKSKHYKPNFPQEINSTGKPIFLQSDLLKFIEEEKQKAALRKATIAKFRPNLPDLETLKAEARKNAVKTLRGFRV